MIDVDILGVELINDQIEVTVAVSTGENDTVSYDLDVTHVDANDTESLSDDLFGGSGSFPGDSNTHTITLDSGGRLNGTVEADVVVTSAPGGLDSDSVDWVIDPTNVIDVEIMGTDFDGNELVVTASVSTGDPIYYEYDMEISDGRGNTVTVPPVGSAELASGAGLPGDSNIHEGRFGVSAGDSGTATAQVVGEPSLSAASSWSFGDPDPPDNGDNGDNGDDDPDPEPPGDIDLDLIDVACGGLPDEVVEGDQSDITWDVVNNNDQPATVTLEVQANGAVIDTESVSVGAGGVESGSTTVLFDQTGDFDIVLSIGGVS